MTAETATTALRRLSRLSRLRRLLRVGAARELLRDPYWPLNAAEALREKVSWPPQYVRAARRDTPLRKPFGVE